MIKECSIYQALLESSKLYKGNVALIYKHKKITYHQLLKRVNQVSFKLKELGFNKNDVITVMLPNVPTAIYLLYAINQIGAIANLIHPLMKYDQLKEIMIKSKSKVLFLLDSNIENFKGFNDLGIKLFAVSALEELSFLIRFVYNHKNKISYYPNNTISFYKNKGYTDYDKDYLKDSFYLHSGGTTGEAKTIALSSYSLNSLTISGLTLLDVTSDENCGMLSVLPLFHGFGLCMGIHASICYGGYNVLIPKFHTKEVISYLKKNQLHTLIGVPTLYEALLRNKDFKGKTISHVINAFVGGDFVSESLRLRFNKRMEEGRAKARLFEGYGLTETVTVCNVNTHKFNKNGSVGKSIPNTKAKIFNNGYECKANECGEIYISGDTLMNGYRFEKDNNKLNPYFIDENNVKWVKTGDYGKIDEEGYLYFVQRLKRIVKVSGVNVFPSQIENALMKLPYIFECYVKGVKDEKKGNILVLYIVLDKKYLGNNYDEELKQLIINNFSIYALPKEIKYIDKMPKTLVGKIDEKYLN